MDNNLLYLQTDLPEVNFMPQTYKNAMELLVNEEIQAQIQSYSADQKESINFVEVAAYALNRLPSLYASSEEGLYRQKQRGKIEFQAQIQQVVSQALAIIKQDPLRFSTPLSSSEEKELQEAKAALEELVDWLWFNQKEKVSWKQAINMIRETLTEEAKIEISDEI